MGLLLQRHELVLLLQRHELVLLLQRHELDGPKAPIRPSLPEINSTFARRDCYLSAATASSMGLALLLLISSMITSNGWNRSPS